MANTQHSQLLLNNARERILPFIRSGTTFQTIERVFWETYRANPDLPVVPASATNALVWLMENEPEDFIQAWDEMLLPIEWSVKRAEKEIEYMKTKWISRRAFSEAAAIEIDFNQVVSLYASENGLDFAEAWRRVLDYALINGYVYHKVFELVPEGS